MGKVLLTLAEERESTTESHFAVRFRVDENDCFDFSNGLKALGHDVYFVNWEDLKGQEFTRMFHDNRKQFVRPLSLTDMDLIFVYKMEGFYFNIPRFLAMVSLFQEVCPLVVNHPDTIGHNIDKGYLFDLQSKGIRIIPTYLIEQHVWQQLEFGQAFVLKPRLGERGNGIFLARSPADLTAIKGKENEYLAQEFIPEIRNGERSLVYLGFDFQHAVIKRPSAQNPDEFRCNESLGGTVDVYQPSDEELSFAGKLLKSYEELGYPVHFSRVDILSDKAGPMLLEAELLNPSIYANYSKKGAQFGMSIARYFDHLMSDSLGSCSASLSTSSSG